MDSALITTAEPQRAPALALTEAVAPVVLTVRSLLRTRMDVATALRNAQFEIRCVAAWDRLPEAVERIQADIVLVDMDVVEKETGEKSGQFSGHRLVTLLARLVARRPTALVVITRLDFAEIEDLARAGISALIPPQAGARRLVQLIQAAMERARERHRRASICPVATTPVADAAAPRDGAAQMPMPLLEVAQIAEMLRRFDERVKVKQLAAPREAAAPPAEAGAPAAQQRRTKPRRAARASKAKRDGGE